MGHLSYNKSERIKTCKPFVNWKIIIYDDFMMIYISIHDNNVSTLGNWFLFRNKKETIRGTGKKLKKKTDSSIKDLLKTSTSFNKSPHRK